MSFRPLRARSLIVLVALLGLAATTTACQKPYPTEDAFYRPPTPIPAGRPGDVIRSRASEFSLDPIFNAAVPGVQAHQILYRSTDALDRPIAVSGTVLVPAKPWTGSGARPLVTYAVGTRGIGDKCAPSYTLSTGTDYEGLLVKSLLDQGWAVAVTDYEGVGTPGTHTYLVGTSAGHAVLDVARAAERLTGTGLSAASPVGIMGYSQGGHAAGWAAQLAGTYAPDLAVKGTVAGGVPGDLLDVARANDGGIGVGLALWAGIGYDAAYPELDITPLLTERGKKFVAENTGGGGMCLVSLHGLTTIAPTLFTHVTDYASPSPLDLPAWQARLKENSLGTLKPSAPVFQYHGGVDELVPFIQAAQLRRRWCNLGAEVEWSILPAEHATGLFVGAPLGVNWLRDRFAGKAELANCWLP